MAKSPEIEHLEAAVKAAGQLLNRQQLPLTEVTQEVEQEAPSHQEGQ